jgi:hypothetical protein
MNIANTALVFFLAWTGQTFSGPPQVADTNGSWTIRIQTGGGFTGQGRGSVNLTSEGNLTCLQTSMPCAANLAADKLLPLTQLISSFDVSKWEIPKPQGPALCSDCYTTTVTLARRQDGNLKVSTLSWNDVTRNRAPAELLRIVEMALSGKW